MYQKYLKTDCLHITKPQSVGKITKMLDNGDAEEVSGSKFNKTSQEKEGFFSKINKTG